MKTIDTVISRWFALTAVLIILTLKAAFSQPKEEKIIISGARFTYPLVEKWISEYQKINPEVKFRIIPRGNPNADSANLVINAHELKPEEIRPNFRVVNISRFALLLVANAKNSQVNPYLEQGIKEKEIKKLFFEKYDPFESEEDVAARLKKEKNLPKFNLYTRQQKACAPTSFAQYYGFEQENLKGKHISGDDRHLLASVAKDSLGVTYNNLGFIYDHTTRKPFNSFKIIPIDANGNGKLDEKEKIYGTLDGLIAKLESGDANGIPLANINLSYTKENTPLSDKTSKFVDWILTKGIDFQHEYGFIHLEPEVLSKQKQLVITQY